MKMDEYINRERARHELALYFQDNKKLVDECDSLICMLPSADVVEVVRCKDCIYSFMSITGETVLYCDMYPSDDHLGWDKDHYCGYGERKDN